VLGNERQEENIGRTHDINRSSRLSVGNRAAGKNACEKHELDYKILPF